VDLRLVLLSAKASSPEVGLRLRGEPSRRIMGQGVATYKRGNCGSPRVVSAGSRATDAGHDEVEAMLALTHFRIGRSVGSAGDR
jgi:hypothetical protein